MPRRRPPNDSSPRVSCRPFEPADWPALVRLFGPNGACGGCWCMWWRRPQHGKLWTESKGPRNREAMRRLVKSGSVYGALAFFGDEPVGWCCVGPKDDFPKLGRTKGLATDADASTWSVTCFFIRSGWRRKGVASALLQEAAEVAKAEGARRMEGYPVAPKQQSQPIPAVFAWTGVPQLFDRAGFRELPHEPTMRPVYVRDLSPSRSRNRS